MMMVLPHAPTAPPADTSPISTPGVVHFIAILIFALLIAKIVRNGKKGKRHSGFIIALTAFFGLISAWVVLGFVLVILETILS